MIVLYLAFVLALGAPVADTRTFDGTGSVGTDTRVEFYLLEGTYEHSLSVDEGCFVAASVFPARGELGVPLADVLQADLSAGTPRPGGRIETAGSIRATEEGWAHVQVGTGAECRWQYTISGMFLPVGEEPVPPDQRGQWWLIIAAAVGVAGLASVLWLRRPSEPPREQPVRVLD